MGVIVGLAAGALACLLMFFIREATTPKLFFHLGFVPSGNLPILALILILSTALIVPQFLTIVQVYRALDVGDALFCIALPQFIVAPLTALILTRVDPRWVMIFGFGAVAWPACWSQKA
jgi:DHA2 family multidrug resistance protein